MDGTDLTTEQARKMHQSLFRLANYLIEGCAADGAHGISAGRSPVSDDEAGVRRGLYALHGTALPVMQERRRSVPEGLTHGLLDSLDGAEGWVARPKFVTATMYRD